MIGLDSPYQLCFLTSMGPQAMSETMVALPAIIITFFTTWQPISGLTAGAVKT
jgi:hypothetical protein